jgi:hypothetical protein
MRRFFITLALPILLMLQGCGTTTTVFIENDLVNDTDKDYTHGTRIQYQLEEVPDFIDQYLPDDTINTFSWSLSQYMYTPDNITNSNYIADSRPYGGWLYVSPMVTIEKDNHMDTFQIDVGVIGDLSFAEETQVQIHEWLDSKDPLGWDNQLEDEIGVNMIYSRKYRHKVTDWIDVIPNAGFSVGNVHTYAGGGATFRAGYNLPEDFGLTRIEPTTRKKDYYIYGMLDFYGRAVGHDIFLEGSLFDEDKRITINKEDLVGEITTGIVVGNGKFETGLLYTIRSDEYEEQDDNQEFGSIIFSIKF